METGTVKGTQVVPGPHQLAAYVHVDDGLVFSGTANSQHVVDTWVHTMANALEEVGFTVTDRQVEGSLQKLVGYEPQTSPARLMMNRKKAVQLIEEGKALYQRRRV